MRRTIVAALVAACSAVLLGPMPAASATEFLYWSYWHATSGGQAWTYSALGASSFRPADRSVEGWRFGVGKARPEFDAAGAFAQVCGNGATPDGKKRVAVVVDFGSDEAQGQDPPSPRVRGDCVEIDTSATGRAVLEAAGFTIRDQNGQPGFICGISGFPSTSCAIPVDKPPAPSASPTPTASPTAKPSKKPTGNSPKPQQSPDTPPSGPGASTPGRPDGGTSPSEPTAAVQPGAAAPPGDPSEPSSQSDAQSPTSSAQLTMGAPKPPVDDSSPLPTLVGLLAVALLAFGAWALRRRT